MGTVYTQLSYQERRKIESWWLAKVPVAEMARVLKRHKSTIFREIKRNFWADDSLPKKYSAPSVRRPIALRVMAPLKDSRG